MLASVATASSEDWVTSEAEAQAVVGAFAWPLQTTSSPQGSRFRSLDT